jgi:hypothetical protein
MKSNRSNNVTHEEISARAHDIWGQSGRPEGQATEHWIRAERELREERGQAEEFEKSAGTSKHQAATGRPSGGRQ